MSNNARCLVTGGAGFIGSHLADKLLANGGKVTVFDNLSSGKIDNITHNLKNPDFKFVKKNLSNVDDIKGALEEQEAVLHLAAYSSVYVEEAGINALYQQNIGNTIKLLEGIRKSSSVKKIIFTTFEPFMAMPHYCQLRRITVPWFLNLTMVHLNWHVRLWSPHIASNMGYLELF